MNIRRPLPIAVGGVLVIAVATSVVIQRQTGNSILATEQVRPRLVLPSIQTEKAYFRVVKSDGTAWERSIEDISDQGIRFSAPAQFPKLGAIRSFGGAIAVMDDGGFLTRQPFTGEWTKASGNELDRIATVLPELSGQKFVRLIFPDRYLFSGGSMMQKEAPLGEKASNPQFSGYYIQKNVAQFELGKGFVVALSMDGSVLAAGDNRSGQCGVQAPARLTSGVRVPIGPAVSIGAGTSHAVAALADGTVWTWGAIPQRQGGQSATPEAFKPRQLPGLKDIVQVVISESGPFILLSRDKSGYLWWTDLSDPGEPPRRTEGLDSLVYAQVDFLGFTLRKDGTAWVVPPPDPKAPKPIQIFDAVKMPETIDAPRQKAGDSPRSQSGCVAYGSEIAEAARNKGIDPLLMAAIAAQETGGPSSDSGRNIRGDDGHGFGIFQIDDRSHGEFTGSPEAMDPAANAAYTAEIMRNLLAKYDGDVKKALSAYNTGRPNRCGAKTGWESLGTLCYADSVIAHLKRLQQRGVRISCEKE